MNYELFYWIMTGLFWAMFVIHYLDRRLLKKQIETWRTLAMKFVVEEIKSSIRKGK